jgi:hypothetical protein
VVWNILKNEPAGFTQARRRQDTLDVADRRRRHRPSPAEDAEYQRLTDLVVSGRADRQPRDDLNVLLVRPDAAPI